MKVHKSENILPRFIAISVIPAIPKKSGRAGICHSLCDRFLGKILLFHMAVRASRLTYATNYYFDISDRPLFLHQQLPIPVSREILMQELSSIISTKWKYRWSAARKIMQKKDGRSEPRYIIVFVFFSRSYIAFFISRLSKRWILISKYSSTIYVLKHEITKG